MLDFKRVRSVTELNNFLWEFYKLDQDAKDEILTQMVLLLAQYKASQSQTELFGPQQAEKSPPKRARARRKRRSRA